VIYARMLNGDQILDTMTHVMAPVVPHLAEEIHHSLEGGQGDKSAGLSVFTKAWQPLVRYSSSRGRLPLLSAMGTVV